MITKLCFIVLLLSGFVVAAPEPWGLALNEDTKECINFWPGDEFIIHDLPEGFVFYAPTHDGDRVFFETSFGSCDMLYNSQNDYSECCVQLESFFIPNYNNDEENLSYMIFILVFFIVVFSVVAFVVYRRRR
jgi:hypothetical protein